MNKLGFRHLLSSTYETLKNLTTTKGEEYSNSDDQHANFKRLGLTLGLEPEQVLLVYLTKHMDSIHYYVKEESEFPGITKLSEPIEGRIDDAILYLCLLKGLIQERAGLQEQADLVADRPSRARTETRGFERELCAGHQLGDKRQGLLDRDKVLQDGAKDSGIDPPLHDGAAGVVDTARGKGIREIVFADRTTGDEPAVAVLPAGGVERQADGGDDAARDDIHDND